MPRSLLCIVAMLWLASANAWANDDAFVIHKGVNLSSWFANAPRQPLYARDFQQIKRAGFDNIRLPVAPELIGFSLTPSPHALDKLRLHAVDQAIQLAVDNGLSVVLDIHPSEALVKTLQDDPQSEKQFTALWLMLAKHYQHYSTNQLAFGLLNEPQYYKQQSQYDAWVGRLVASIRAQDKNHFLVIGAARGSSIDGLMLMKPISDARIIYDFHFYEPYMVTHQGAGWGFEKQMLRYFHDVPYPPDRANHDAHFYAPDAPNPAQAQSELTEYTYAKWNASHIRYRLQEVTRWATANKVQVICGEFGVLRHHIDATSRYRWIEDTRKALEDDNIGWEVWDYTDNFGIAHMVGETTANKDGSVRFVHPEKGERIIDAQAISALGLTTP